MKRIIFFLGILLGTLSNLSAQETLREAGIRGGITSGITYRHYLEHNFSYEGLLSFRQNGLQFTLLRQIHEQTLLDVADNLFLVYGYGAHAGYFFASDYNLFINNRVFYNEKRFSPVVGIDGYAALEYRLSSYPVSISLDFKPFFEASAYQYFKISIWDIAFAFKYRF